MNNPGFTGKKHSEESNIKRSRSLKLYWMNHKDEAVARASSRKGKPLSESQKIKISNNHADVSLEKNPRWNGGKRTTKFGYILIKKRDHPYCDKNGYVSEHRLVVENAFKMTLLPMAVIHHKNGVKTDNRLENLEILTKSEHMKVHSSRRERNKQGAFV
jgi:hypothetical protein